MKLSAFFLIFLGVLFAVPKQPKLVVAAGEPIFISPGGIEEFSLTVSVPEGISVYLSDLGQKDNKKSPYIATVTPDFYFEIKDLPTGLEQNGKRVLVQAGTLQVLLFENGKRAQTKNPIKVQGKIKVHLFDTATDNYLREEAVAFTAQATIKAESMVWGARDISQIHWLNDMPSAMDKARSENKLVFAYYTANWCGSCAHLSQHLFTNPDVINTLNTQVVPVKIDASTDYKKLHVAVPTMRLLRPNDGGSPEIIKGELPRVVQRFLAELQASISGQAQKPSAIAPDADYDKILGGWGYDQMSIVLKPKDKARQIYRAEVSKDCKTSATPCPPRDSLLKVSGNLECKFTNGRKLLLCVGKGNVTDTFCPSSKPVKMEISFTKILESEKPLLELQIGCQNSSGMSIYYGQ